MTWTPEHMRAAKREHALMRHSCPALVYLGKALDAIEERDALLQEALTALDQSEDWANFWELRDKIRALLGKEVG